MKTGLLEIKKLSRIAAAQNIEVKNIINLITEITFCRNKGLITRAHD